MMSRVLAPRGSTESHRFRFRLVWFLRQASMLRVCGLVKSIFRGESGGPTCQSNEVWKRDGVSHQWDINCSQCSELSECSKPALSEINKSTPLFHFLLILYKIKIRKWWFLSTCRENKLFLIILFWYINFKLLVVRKLKIENMLEVNK